MQTPFEMRAGLPKKEPKMLEDWEQNHVYEQMIKNNEGKPQYILHDGPPYANGNIHMGTALNKIIKDIIIRYKNMSGFQAPYVPGYDTHGLPIELKALSSLGDKKAGVSKLELRQICKEFATEHIGVMNEQFKRLGVQGDFENPYLTLRPEFEARQVEIFGEMAKKGYIYKGMKAVYWCPEDRTALAEAEIEYAEDECDSIYVRFKLTDDPNGVLAKHNIPLDKAWIVIWTTTTWTLPANVATCLNPNLEYAFVKIGDAYHIMARELVESTMKGCHIDEYEVLPETVLGSELELMQYQHPFLDRKGLVILGDHVTLEGGTGCVHTAPGHGVEDFEVCVNHYPQVPVVVPVDDAGRLTAEAGEKFAGLKVWDANKVILEHIKESGHLMGVQHITHQYPHCWRCHHPIIFRATEQWFCSIDAFKEDVYKAIDSVHWQPAWGHDRMAGMVRDRSDWCISRQRVWGVPIPVFYCKKCGKYHITDASIKAVSDLFRKEGSDAWYKYDANDILPKTEVCECGASDWEKDPDIMDVWFDSGSTWSAVCRERPELRWPVDMYMEGADQFRGWFQSSLLTSVATQGVAPYREVLCHGWVVDAQGKQMHKSAGNGMEPSEIIRDYGADIIRLWVASSDYTVDVRAGKEIFRQLSEAYRKMRNT
ncbi:isoleucine--tRNA ligase, partial [Gemmiger formicilis]